MSANKILTEDQIKEFKEGFDLFDKDGDGLIALNELGTIMRALAVNPTEAELQEMMNELEEVNNPTIDFPEFIGFMARKLRIVSPKEELLEAFKIFDRDGSGMVTFEEFKVVARSFGEKEQLTEEEIQEMIREADVDSDSGLVPYKEFVKMVF